KESKTWTDEKLDEALFELRKRLEQELPGQVLDFYESPLNERWKRSKVSESNEKTTDGHRFWVEKTIVNGRPDRESGDHAVGKSPGSPHVDDGGKKISGAIKEVQPGDLIFLLANNEVFDIFSIAESAADSSFIGITGTGGGGRPPSRIPLKAHEKIAPP